MTDTPPSNTATPTPAYPLPAPTSGVPRFSYGLLHEVADALQRNGFPRPEGTDWAQLITCLGRFLYQPKETS